MNTLLVIAFGILIIAGVAVPIAYWQARKLFREQKNYERGLKMVPLLIHLPPQSDDTELGGRDVRDVVDENISKAQIIYNIIASQFTKGFKSKFYGQRHFAFEIVGSKGFVHFYAAVPISMVEVIKQAIVSAYPAARLEEVSEHNVFSPVGKISATIGGELTLKESFAYPIATYQDLKRDAMQSLLNALSTLDKDDGVGIQFLLRPANPAWRKNASLLAGKKRKGKESKKGSQQILSIGKQFASAAWKPPEDKAKEKADKPELSNLEQSVLDAIEDKTRHPGYEVLIRVVASSNISQRAQVLLNNVIATFALYDAPGKNGFKYTAAKDIESFVTAYILRFFPQENNKNILNSIELSTLFHFPDQRNIPTSQLERQDSKQVDGPRNMPDDGLLMGYNIFRGAKKPIRLALEDRRRHVYAVGQTGTGKSTFLENLALQDMIAGEGFAFIDPHGDTAENLLAKVPRERTEDVVYFSPAEMDYPMGLNLFEFNTPDQRDFLIQEAINMLYKLYDPQHQGIMGPRYEHMFRNLALTIMSNPAGGTFIDIPKLFTDKAYERQLKAHVKDPTVLDFWNKEMAATSDYHKSEVMGWFVSKFGAFLGNEMMRNIIGQSKSAFDLREIMDNKKILIVNLSKGRLGELNSKLLGMVFVMKFQAAAMSRSNIPEEEREDFCLYVDEFQNFTTDSFAAIMSEARKYRLNLIVANQFTTQLTEEIRDAVFGNIGTVVSFRVGQTDADVLAKYFTPMFEASDLLRVPNFNAVVRTLVGGVPTQPFSMAGLPKLGKPNKQLAEALKQLTAAKYGRPKATVEKEIFARLKADEEPKPAMPPAGGAFGSPFTPPTKTPWAPPTAGTPPPPMRPAAPASGSSFLDDWLAKRKTAPSPGAGQMPPNPFAALQSPPGVAPPAMPAYNAPAPYTPPITANPVVPSTAPPIPPVPPLNNQPPAPQGIGNKPPEPITISNAQSAAQPSVPTDTHIEIPLNKPKPVEAAKSALPAAPKEMLALPKQAPKSDNAQASQDPEDTIFIDNEGNLRLRDEN